MGPKKVPAAKPPKAPPKPAKPAKPAKESKVTVKASDKKKKDDGGGKGKAAGGGKGAPAGGAKAGAAGGGAVGPKTPIIGVRPRIERLLKMHYRGIFGVLVPLLTLTWQGIYRDFARTTALTWAWMFWFFLLQPVSVPVTGLIPIFMMPMGGVMSTDKTASCYMNEGIALFILTNMLVLLLNNSGFDRRVILWFLCAGDICQFSASRMLLKCSCAGFVLSIFCSRLITCSILTQYMSNTLINLQTTSPEDSGRRFDRIRFITNNAIQTSCSIGSIAIIHSSYATLAFRTIFYQSVETNKAWPDIFNYLEYSVFAFPVAIIMFILNLIYNMVLVNTTTGEDMTTANQNTIRNAMMKYKGEIPSHVTNHEKLTVFFTLLYLIFFFTRWTKYFPGWGDYSKENGVPWVHDATVAGIFVILLTALPNSLRFLRILNAQKRSQVEPLRAESAIMWWRFVDLNTNYCYILLIGSGVTISVAARHTGLDKILSNNAGKLITENPWEASLFLVCVLTVILANSMSSVAAVVVFLPFIVNMTAFPATATLRTSENQNEWVTKVYLGALAVGIGASLGFCWPFLYTPAYFTHHFGKVPKLTMAMYGVGSAVICLLVLWITITYYASFLWNSSIAPVDFPFLPSGNYTTAKTTQGSEGALIFMK